MLFVYLSVFSISFVVEVNPHYLVHALEQQRLIVNCFHACLYAFGLGLFVGVGCHC
jgi:hypothetical protein